MIHMQNPFTPSQHPAKSHPITASTQSTECWHLNQVQVGLRLLGCNSLNTTPEGHFFSKDLRIRNKLSPPQTQYAVAKHRMTIRDTLAQKGAGETQGTEKFLVLEILWVTWTQVGNSSLLSPGHKQFSSLLCRVILPFPWKTFAAP